MGTVIEVIPQQVLPGERLTNGWTVVDVWHDFSQEKFGDLREQGVVLAMRPDAVEPFATWSFVVDGEDEAGRMRSVTTTGHYFESIFPAAKDFARRVGMRGE